MHAQAVRKITPDGTVTTLASNLGIAPSGIALDAAGNVYTGGWLGKVLLKITPDGTVTELAGKRGSSGSTDGRGDAARFHLLIGVTSDDDGVLWVMDVTTDLGYLAVRRVAPDGTVTTLKGDWRTYRHAAGRFGPVLHRRLGQPNDPYDAVPLHAGSAGRTSSRNSTAFGHPSRTDPPPTSSASVSLTITK